MVNPVPQNYNKFDRQHSMYKNVNIHKVSLCGNSLSLQVVMAVFPDGNMPNESFEGIFIFKEDAFSHLDIMRLIVSKVFGRTFLILPRSISSIIFLPDWHSFTFILFWFIEKKNILCI